MTIYFVRHGAVEDAFVGKYNGHIDISLSKKGKEQARKLGEKLREIDFDAIFCSDLRRAKETLEAMALSQKNVVYTQALREKSWGRHEGKSFEEISQEGIVYKNFSQWIKALDGESLESYRRRVERFFQEVLLRQNARNILVITHAGVIKTLIAFHKGISLDESFAIALPYGEYIRYSDRKGFMV